MNREPNIKQHKDGRWGLYVGEHFIGIAKTEVLAETKMNLLKAAFTDIREDAYDSGYADGTMDHY